ncbi:MAG: tetratricopeptide repeat protein [Planctomycetota bacterium]|jgi:tetratricopeptide (TPR) repeat protein
MAAKKDKRTITEHSREVGAEENTSEVPLDHELFAGEVHEELSEREAFTGNEDFYKFLADSTQAAADHQPASAGQSPPEPVRRRPQRFSTLQKVLAASIIVIGTTLLYVLLKPLLWPLTDITTHIAQQTPSSKPPVEDFTQVEPQQIQEPEAGLAPTQPLSLKVAQDFYLQKDYDKAYDIYNQLRQSLPASAEEELPRDFLQLRMALCLKNTGDSSRAEVLFRTLLRSHSPVVRVVAGYRLSLFEMENKQYLKARARAYQTIALIGAVDLRLRADEFTLTEAGDKYWALLLQRNCHFLVAEAMTRNILSLCDTDTDLPGKLWGNYAELDPFTDLNETQLRYLLNSGSEQLNKGLLGPQIRKFERQGASPRWSVVCHGASIEELLIRFAANADLDISWAYSKTPAVEEGPGFAGIQTRDTIRKRPVSLSLPAATAQQFVTVAAGHVGLLARLDDEGLVNIFNPVDYSSLSEHISLLIRETISLWQEFLLTYHSDQRLPNAHFALGLLHNQEDRVSESIAEYKLVANRFSQTSLAPFALLNSSKLKANLRDYPGARRDLTQLVEQYPDTEFYGQACLNLADATMKAGLLHEAGRLYRKVYYLGLSLELRAASALGAGRCSYEKKDYEIAAKWLTEYIKLARDGPSKDPLYLAYFLLGKTNVALGKPQQACDAFQSALGPLTGQLPGERAMETISALVEAQIQLEDLVGALAVLENIRSWQFSKAESIEILLLKSKVFRSMGLVDKAIVALGDRAEYLPDSQLKIRMSFELANCYIAKGNLEFARKKLAEILVMVEPGLLAHEIALKLAEVCLKLDQNSQAVSICLRLLDSGPSAPILQKALKILATAHNRLRDYDKAALALLGRWYGTEAPSEGTIFDSTTPISR